MVDQADQPFPKKAAAPADPAAQPPGQPNLHSALGLPQQPRPDSSGTQAPPRPSASSPAHQPELAHRAARERQLSRMRDVGARVVRVASTLIALALIFGAFLVFMKDNVTQENPLVKLVYGLCNFFDGPLSRDQGIFSFSGEYAEAKNALVNWGLAALAYLVAGRFLSGWIESRRSSA